MFHCTVKLIRQYPVALFKYNFARFYVKVGCLLLLKVRQLMQENPSEIIYQNVPFDLIAFQ